MNKIGVLAFGVGLAAAGMACSSESHPSAATVEAGLPGEAGQTFRTLFHNNASVNLIFLNNTGDVFTPDSSLYAPYQAMKEHDQAYLEAAAIALNKASVDQYTPELVKAVDVPAVYSVDDCIEINSEESLASVQEIAKPYIDRAAVNVIVADTLFCEEDAFIPGKTSPDFPPLLTAIASQDFISVILPHELGHAAGLGHAGEIICKDPVNLDGCQGYPTTDYLSVMGYRDGQSFSTAELYALGLINSDFVLREPEDGEYSLRGLDQQDSDAPYGLVVPSDSGELFVSWEKDPLVSEDQPYTPQIRKVGTDGIVTHFSLLTSGGYTSSQALDKMGKPKEGIIYKDDSLAITYLGVNELGEALVRIDH